MFEDFKEGASGEFDEHAPDRAIVHAIWTRVEAGGLDADEGWAILLERYPTEPRFLLLAIYEGIRRPLARDGAPALHGKLERVAGVALPAAAIRDLLSLVRARLPAAAGARFDALALRFGDARADAAEAADRLTKLERLVLEELHDRTLGNRPLATKLAAASRANDYATLVARSEEKREIAYSPSEHLVVGDRVRHPKFGVGVVIGKRGNKAEIAFPDARRTLVCR